jgi:hypothetical protein
MLAHYQFVRPLVAAAFEDWVVVAVGAFQRFVESIFDSIETLSQTRYRVGLHRVCFLEDFIFTPDTDFYPVFAGVGIGFRRGHEVHAARFTLV